MLSQTSTILSSVGNVFQIIEAIAVVATLAFIALQIRQARYEAAGNSYQAILQSANSFYSTLAMSEDFAHIYLTGRLDPSSLDDKQRARFFYGCVQWFCFYENMFLQYSHKLLPRQYFEAWRTALEEDLKDPGFRWYWHLEKSDFAPEFREYVDQIVEKIEGEAETPESRMKAIYPFKSKTPDR